MKHDLADSLRAEAKAHRPVAPASLDAAVLRTIRETPRETSAPRTIRFPVTRAIGLAACLAVTALIGAFAVRQYHESQIGKMQALATDMGNAAAFFARAVKPITHGIRC